MLKPEDIDRLVAILDCPSDQFAELVQISGLNPGRDFRGADLRQVDFRTDDLTGFDFSGANLCGANLSRAVGLEAVKLAGVKFDAATRWSEIQRNIMHDESDRDRHRVAQPASEFPDTVDLQILIENFTNKGLDRNIRQHAAQAIGNIGVDAADAVPVLASFLNNADYSWYAADALARIGTPSVPALTAALADKDPDVRYYAGGALGKIEAAGDALPALSNLLKDIDPDVRQIAAQTLGKIRPAAVAAVPALSISLTDLHHKVRRSSAKALGALGPAAADAVPALVAALADTDQAVQRVSAWALGEIGTADAVPALAKALKTNLHREAAGALRKIEPSVMREIGPASSDALPALVAALVDTDQTVQRASAWALGEIGATDAVPALAKALKTDLRREAANALRKIGADALRKIGPAATDAVPALLAALADTNEAVRQVSAWALDEIGTADAVPALAKALKSNLHREAAEALRKIEPDALRKIGPAAAADAVPALLAALADSNEVVRQVSAWALGQIGTADALPALANALRNNFHREAAEALRKIGADTDYIVPVFVAALQDTANDHRETAADSLGKMGPAAADAIPALVVGLADSNEAVRRTAAWALGEIGTADAVPALADALTTSRWRLAAETLRKIGSNTLKRAGPIAADAVPAFITALVDTNKAVQHVAAWALGEIGTADAVPALANALRTNLHREAAGALRKIEANTGDTVPVFVAALQDTANDRRETAADALGKIGPSAADAVPALVTALADTDEAVQRAAVRALGGIGTADTVPILAKALKTKIHQEAAEALRKIGADTFQKAGPIAADVVPALISALADTHEAVRQVAAWALGEIGTADAVPALANALTTDLRREAADALRKIGADTLKKAGPIVADAVPAFIAALVDTNKTVQYVAAWALGEIGTADAVPALADALRTNLHREAAAALRKIGGDTDNMVPVFVAALQDTANVHRETAADALGKIGPVAVDAVPALATALADRNPNVRRNAAEALERIGPRAAAAVPSLTAVLEDRDIYVQRNARLALKAILGEPMQQAGLN